MFLGLGGSCAYGMNKVSDAFDFLSVMFMSTGSCRYNLECDHNRDWAILNINNVFSEVITGKSAVGNET